MKEHLELTPEVVRIPPEGLLLVPDPRKSFLRNDFEKQRTHGKILRINQDILLVLSRSNLSQVVEKMRTTSQNVKDGIRNSK